MARLLCNQHVAWAVWHDTPFGFLLQLTAIPSFCLADELISVLRTASAATAYVVRDTDIMAIL